MARRTRREIENWSEFTEGGRTFVRAIIPRGQNEDQEYTAARRIAERYEIKRFFASGGFGLILVGKDVRTETDMLIKTTLSYDVSFEARWRDGENFTKKVWARRQQLQTERRIMVQLRNRGCDGIPNPNDYVFDRNPLLAGPYSTEDGKKWKYTDEGILDTEPYLVLEMIEGRTLSTFLDDRWSDGMDEHRALEVMRQVAGVLAILHQPWDLGGASWRLIYQDLKPANIMLGAGDRAYLIDLGGCRLTIDGKLRQEGAHTPGYCPLESTLAQMTITPAADSYTAGSTLFHLLTGKPPLSFLPDVIRSADEHAVRPENWDSFAPASTRWPATGRPTGRPWSSRSTTCWGRRETADRRRIPRSGPGGTHQRPRSSRLQSHRNRSRNAVVRALRGQKALHQLPFRPPRPRRGGRSGRARRLPENGPVSLPG
jgi:serine/threonine protein kinase